MNIYPAIDVRNGKCIRLYQGNYELETVYSADPYSMAKTFISEGASWIHIVDLDGARNPDQSQGSLISKILNACNVKIQTGGGIRTKQQIEMLLKQGAERIIIGSSAINNSKAVFEWFEYFGAERLVLALDVKVNSNKQPMVTVNAWQMESDYSLYDLIEYYKRAGLKHLLSTNISLDGTLKGPDYGLYDSLLEKFPFLNLQASGGVQSLSDIVALRKNKLSGTVIGRAFYEKKFTLREALSC